MLLKKALPALLLASTIALTLPSCKKHSDSEVKAKVEAAIASVPGVTVDVKDGVVTLSGLVGSDDEKTNVETAANALNKDGVKSVVDNIQVEAAPIAPVPAAPVTDSLTAGVKDATKDFPTVTATVDGGVITVTGEVAQSKVRMLKQSLDALHPKKVDMSALKVK